MQRFFSLGRPSSWGIRRALAPLLLWSCCSGLGGAAGCGGSAPRDNAASELLEPVQRVESARGQQPLAELPSGTVGPFLTPVASGWVALWASPEEESAAWFSRGLYEDGKPRGDARQLFSAAGQIRLVRAVSLPGGKVLALFTSLGTSGESLHAMTLGPEGELLTPAAPVIESRSELVWLDAIPTPAGALLLWAERTGDRAELAAMRRDEAGGMGEVRSAAKGVRSWQAVPNGSGALLATVNGEGSVELRALNDRGEPSTAAAVSDAAKNSELDLVAAKDGFILAFAERSHLEARVMTVLARADGSLLTQPASATEARGEQALVRLVGGRESYLVWQNVNQEAEQFRVGRLSAAGEVRGAELVVPVNPGLPEPLFATASSGLAALVWACPKREQCTAEVPIAVRTDTELQPSSATAWALPGGTDLAWDLQCQKQRCIGLAASFGSPSQVFTQDTTPGSPSVALPVWQQDKAVPRSSSVAAAFETPELSDLAATHSGGGQLVAWLSYFDPSTPYEKPTRPAPDGRMKPVRALLTTQWLGDDWRGSGTELPAPTVLSYRARSTAGLALARKNDRSLLAWSAVDGEQPQVFTTLVGGRGERISQRMQTRTKGEVQQVRVASAERGWLLAWSDERSGRPRSYLARLEDNLNRRTPDVALPADGEASTMGLDVGIVGREVWLLAAEHQPDAVRLFRAEDGRLTSLADASVLAQNEVVLEPVLALGATKWAAWLVERGEMREVVAAELDDSGNLVAAPRVVEGVQQPERLRANCDAEHCHLVATGRDARGPALFGVSLSSAPLRARVLSRLVAPSGVVVAPALTGESIWYFDAIPSTGRRGVHAAEVLWQ